MIHLLALTQTQDLQTVVLSIIIVLANTWLANKKQEKTLKDYSDKGREDIRREIIANIQAGTELSRIAFKEANNLNQKIEDTRVLIDKINLEGTKKSSETFIILHDRFEQLDKRLQGIELSLLHLNEVRTSKENHAHGLSNT